VLRQQIQHVAELAVDQMQAPREARGQACRHEAGQRGRSQSHAEGEADENRGKPAAFQVDPDQDGGEAKAESAKAAGTKEQPPVSTGMQHRVQGRLFKPRR